MAQGKNPYQCCSGKDRERNFESCCFKEVLDAKRKAANLGSTGMPDKLADCRTHGEDSELLIVEGTRLLDLQRLVAMLNIWRFFRCEAKLLMQGKLR